MTAFQVIDLLIKFYVKKLLLFIVALISECEDRYPNCHFVVKARLCTYDYYIENCCAACKEAISAGY